jgi:hypothetical protein
MERVKEEIESDCLMGRLKERGNRRQFKAIDPSCDPFVAHMEGTTDHNAARAAVITMKKKVSEVEGWK